MIRLAPCVLLLTIAGCFVTASPISEKQKENMSSASSCSDFPVIEFRRYTIRDGERMNFARYFEAYFPEAMQQLGAIAAGEFLERSDSSHFTWIRGFHSMDDRAKANALLYYGPVWKEHKALMNSLMTDSDNVMLLHSVKTDCGITVLPAVDPIKETGGAQGVVVAQIFAVKPGATEKFLQDSEAMFTKYVNEGVREAGLFATLDAANNFPQLPVRTDGPFVVWLGIVKDNGVLDQQFRKQAEDTARALLSTGRLRDKPELVILDPAPRSRMRWLAEWR